MTSTTTCPGPAAGSGSSPGTSTPGGPNSIACTARIVTIFPCLANAEYRNGTLAK
jgi:hypothetical protein